MADSSSLKRKSLDPPEFVKKRKHTVITLLQKQEIIKRFESGLSKASLSKIYGIGQSQ